MDPLKTSFRGALGVASIAFVLAFSLSILPAWAGQNQQPAASTSVQQPAEQPPGQAAQPESGQAAAPAEPAPAEVPASLTLPAGTIISIRTSQFLSSDRNRTGDSFTAELQQPLVANGWVVARHGQTVIGRVVLAKKAGRIKGVSQLQIELSRLILVDGQQLPITTQLMQSSGGTSKGRDATAVATTTGIGAAIGATARDAGEGAGIGAAIGAGAGLAGVLLTRGRPTEIPPESVLTFDLQSPVTFSTVHSQVAFRPVTQSDYNAAQSAPRLQRRVRRYPPPPYYYGSYYPWGYFYPGSMYIGFDYYRFGGFRHRGWRR